MIKRIVRLCFKEDYTEEFENIFNNSKSKIIAFEGCYHLELCKDLHDRRIYFTISYWKDEAALNQYRNSAFFEDTWSKTKLLFDDKPLAYSLLTKEIVQNYD